MAGLPTLAPSRALGAETRPSKLFLSIFVIGYEAVAAAADSLSVPSSLSLCVFGNRACDSLHRSYCSWLSCRSHCGRRLKSLHVTVRKVPCSSLIDRSGMHAAESATSSSLSGLLDAMPPTCGGWRMVHALWFRIKVPLWAGRGCGSNISGAQLHAFVEHPCFNVSDVCF